MTIDDITDAGRPSSCQRGRPMANDTTMVKQCDPQGDRHRNGMMD